MANEKERTGVWRRGSWDWAYRFKTSHGGDVYGCGFNSRERAYEAMREAKARRARRPDER